MYFVIHTYYPTFRQDEDVIQAGMLGLCQAANTWNEELSAFSTYATTCIKFAICKEFSRRKKHKGVLSLDYEYSDHEGETKTLGDTLIGDEDVDFVDLENIYKHITERDREIIEMRQYGLTNKQIAEKYGVSEQMIHKRVRKIRKIWRKVNGD